MGTDAGTTEPLSVNAGPDVVLCAGGAAQLGPAPASGLEYSWSPTDGLSSATEAQPMASPSSTTTYVVTVTDPLSGRTGSDSVVVTVNPLPVAEVSAPAKVCGGSRWSLSGINSTAIAPATLTDFSWTFGSQQLSGMDVELTAPNGPATLSASLTVTDSNGCSASSTVQGQALELPVASAGSNRIIGKGSSVQIGAPAVGGAAPYTYSWSATPACPEGSCLSSASVAEPTVTPVESTEFTVVVTDAESCSGSDSVLVLVDPPLTANAGGDKIICEGQSTSIGLSASGGVSPYTYSWSASPVCTGCLSSTTVASPTASPGVTTVFTQTVTDATAQSASASATVTVYPSPGTAGDNAFLDSSASIVIGPEPLPGASHLWSCNRTDCALSATDVAQPVVSPTHSTTYTLEATSEQGCSTRSSLTVWVNLRADTVPQDGELAFPANSTLLVQFDQPMVSASMNTSTVQLHDAITGTQVAVGILYEPDNRLLRVKPTSNLSANGEYTLTLAGGPTGIISNDPLLPNIFPGDLMVDFTAVAADGTAPGISFRSPAANATGVPNNTSVVVTFNEPVDPVTVTATTFTLGSAGGQVTGTVLYEPKNRTATFTPTVPLGFSTAYTVSLSGIKDLSNNAMPLTTWSFTTGMAPDTVPPTVTAVTPVDGTQGVVSSDPVLVTFSEDVDFASLSGIRLLHLASGTQVAGTVSYNTTTRVATFVPTVLLGSMATYEVNVGGVKDLAGNAMAAPFASRFTTRQTLFSDNFEKGTAAWFMSTSTSGTPWSLTTSSFHSATNSLTDSAGGKYGMGVESHARLAQSLNVSGLASVTLQFWMRVRTVKNKDTVFVEASFDNGATWPRVLGSFSGNQGWAVRSLPLSLPAGTTQLQLRFRLKATTTNRTADGVYIDDVILQSP